MRSSKWKTCTVTQGKNLIPGDVIWGCSTGWSDDRQAPTEPNSVWNGEVVIDPRAYIPDYWYWVEYKTQPLPNAGEYSL